MLYKLGQNNMIFGDGEMEKKEKRYWGPTEMYLIITPQDPTTFLNSVIFSFS
jgi:hypothetical protein